MYLMRLKKRQELSEVRNDLFINILSTYCYHCYLPSIQAKQKILSNESRQNNRREDCLCLLISSMQERVRKEEGGNNEG